LIENETSEALTNQSNTTAFQVEATTAFFSGLEIQLALFSIGNLINHLIPFLKKFTIFFT